MNIHRYTPSYDRDVLVNGHLKEYTNPNSITLRPWPLLGTCGTLKLMETNKSTGHISQEPPGVLSFGDRSGFRGGFSFCSAGPPCSCSCPQPAPASWWSCPGRGQRAASKRTWQRRSPSLFCLPLGLYFFMTFMLQASLIWNNLVIPVLWQSHILHLNRDKVDYFSFQIAER